MKKLILLFAIALFFTQCKKSNSVITSGPAGLDVQVSGLTAATAVNIKIYDNNTKVTVMDIKNQFGTNTYTSSYVYVGDVLTITYSTNIPDDKSGNGDGTMKFFYKEKQQGAVSGILTGSVNETVTQ